VTPPRVADVRLALVCPYSLAAPGGVQSHVLQLARALGGLGDEVTVIAPDAAAAGDGGATRRVDVGGTLPVRFNDSVAPVALGPAAVTRTRRALHRARPDVVHVHEPMVPWAGLTAVWSSRAPVVATFHAWSDRDRLYSLTRPLGRLLARRLAVRVAVSEAAAAYHAEALGWPTGTFRIVPNGVDVARFANAAPFEEVAGASAPSLLFVGRLEQRKGLEQAVRAFTRLKADRPDLQLHVVGEGAQLERATALLPSRLRADVRFHGRVPTEDVPRWFASCDLYVSPALGGESFGIVLLEAMAAGRAFVASDIPGYRSVATDGVQGRLVPPGDVGELAEAVGALLDNPALRAAMGAEGSRTAADYDWDRVARRLRSLYGEASAAGPR
jgi:phosphatidyl-myo-inositol alpha-mannosyltransferase